MLKFNRDCCDAVAGNTRAGKFLSKLLFWLNSPNAPVFDGHRWVAFTREKWAEKTGLTVDQIRRILIALATGELIFCEQHKYGGKVPNFIRLSPKGIKALCAAQVAQKCATQVAQKCATLKSNLKEINEKSKKSADGFAAADPEEGCIPEKKSYSEEVGSEIKFPEAQGGADMTTAAEIAAQFAAAKPKSIDTLKPDKAYSLVAVWQASGQIVPGFTKKELGQLKYLIGKWPPGKAPAILAFVLGHWYEMTEAVEKNTTKFKSPASPDLGYLVKYQNIALTVFQKGSLKVTKVTAPEVVQTIAQPEYVKEKPITMAEILAMEEAEKVAS